MRKRFSEKKKKEKKKDRAFSKVSCQRSSHVRILTLPAKAPCLLVVPPSRVVRYRYAAVNENGEQEERVVLCHLPSDTA